MSGRALPLWPLASAALAVAVLAVVAVGIDSPVRPVLVLPFLLLAPGMAVVRLLRLSDPVAEFMLSVALSVALAGAAAGVMAYGHVWSPVGGLVGLTILTLTANSLDVVSSSWWRSRP